MTKHRSPNANKENVTCKGPYDIFYADEDEGSRETISTEEPNDVLTVAMAKRLMDINDGGDERVKKEYGGEQQKDEEDRRGDERDD